MARGGRAGEGFSKGATHRGAAPGIFRGPPRRPPPEKCGPNSLTGQGNRANFDMQLPRPEPASTGASPPGLPDPAPAPGPLVSIGPTPSAPPRLVAKSPGLQRQRIA